MIVNEWLFHDIRGDNGLAAQRRVGIFLEEILNGNRRIIIPQGTRWMDKAWQLWNVADPRVQILSKLFYFGIYLDSLKSTHLHFSQLQPLPADLAATVPADDDYLFQAALASGANLIVTTDGRLVDAASNAAQNYNIVLEFRDDHYQQYPGLQNGTP